MLRAFGEVDLNSAPTIPQIKLPGSRAAASDNPSQALPLAKGALPPHPERNLDADPLTPRLLEALALLDSEASRLDALAPTVAPLPVDDDSDEPEWLKEAAEAAAAPSPSAAAEPWDEEAAQLQGMLADLPSGKTSTSSTLSWLDKQLIPIVAASFPHLDRLVRPSILAPSSAADRAAELLCRRDSLKQRDMLLSERKERDAVVAALAYELRCVEEACRHLRSSAESQVKATAEVLTQLEATKSAAEGTAAAARRIVDDHEKDVALLMGELRRLSPEAADSVEARLSAPMAALRVRRRQAKALAPSAPAEDDTTLERIGRAATEMARDVGREVVRRASSPFRGRARSPFRGRP
jgi:hypothetical protein